MIENISDDRIHLFLFVALHTQRERVRTHEETKSMAPLPLESGKDQVQVLWVRDAHSSAGIFSNNDSPFGSLCRLVDI